MLKQKLGEQEAEALVTFVDAKIRESNDTNLKTSATKADLAETKTGIIKWMFLFWIGQIAVAFGFILFL